MSPDRRDTIIVKKLLKEINDIESFTAGIDAAGFEQSLIVQKAVVMSLINIGELSKKISQSFIDATESIPWKKLRGLRNLAAHNYDALRMPNIWLTVVNDLPELKATLVTQQTRL